MGKSVGIFYTLPSGPTVFPCLLTKKNLARILLNKEICINQIKEIGMLLSKYKKTLLAAVLTMTWASPSFATLSLFDYTVTIESGSKNGQTFGGSFSVNTGSLTGIGIENVATSSFSFNYPASFLSTITAQFSNGIFSKIIGQNGPNNARYGFNSGFSSGQVSFGCAAISCSAGNYFGYLDSNTFVDGFGVVNYTLTATVPEPSTLGLLGAGLLGLGFIRRRRAA